MEENKFYTKGKKDNVLKRINQIHTITIYCPVQDPGVSFLRENFEILLSGYRIDGNLWSGVPAIDALNVFMMTIGMAQNDTNMDIVFSISGALKMFKRLKYINFQFVNDPEIEETYRNPTLRDKSSDRKEVYKLETLEMNLSDMFSQEVIDILNKVLMMNEIIPNSYMERKFSIQFTYDEYISFMDMFLGHNAPMLQRLDGNICDYFRTFPVMVNDQKPNIRLITNYKEL